MTSHLLDPASTVTLRSPDGARATLLLHGAQLVSWQPAAGRGLAGAEQLYLSERARVAPGAAVRGGVPVIFPQFEQRGPLPRHGFARTATWSLASETTGADHATAVLRLLADAATRQVWPHDFVAELTVSIAATRVDVELSVENTGGEPFDFTCALHTYLRLDDARLATVEGLEGVRYLDSLAGGEERSQTHGQLHPLPQIDRIYLDVPPCLALREPGRRVSVEQDGFEDAVVWNPGADGARALADLPPEGYLHFCCLEAAQIARPVHLAPGGQWQGRQALIAS
jgi:glucose-6-phosphate 1-epimerase